MWRARNGLFGFPIVTPLLVRIRFMVKRSVQERQKYWIGGKANLMRARTRRCARQEAERSAHEVAVFQNRQLQT
jgi:hypothetical protein